MKIGLDSECSGSACLIYRGLCSTWVFQVALVVKNLPVSAGEVRDVGLIPIWKDPLEKGMATHSSVLAWKIPEVEEAGGPQSMSSQRERHDRVTEHTHKCLL